MKNIDFFFDLSSPYSYLAATQLPSVAERAGAQIRWLPFVLGAVFKAAGNVMPAASPPKARYMLDDLTRWADEYGVPFRMNTRFPVNALKAMRLVVAAEAEDRAADVAQTAFRALWVDDRDVTAPEELRAIAVASRLDAERALVAIESAAIKERLRAYTDDAIRRGAFGAPSFFVGEQLFWGNDRLHQVEAALRRLPG